jgi:hypothetical protein
MSDDQTIRVDTARLERLILERGGDPTCLHCQAACVLDEWMAGRPEGPVHAMQLAMALAGVVGDLLQPCPPGTLRVQAAAAVLREVGRHCGLELVPLATGDATGDAGSAPPAAERKVH